MNKYLSSFSLASAALLLAGTAMAAPQELSADQLEWITAGTDSNPPPNGGAIVGNGSSAELKSAGEVIIDNAQSDVRALNIVNSSESTVANGVNIFSSQALVDGDIVLPDAIDNAVGSYNIEQVNTVTQDQRRLSSLPDYQRGANTYSDSAESGTYNSTGSDAEYDQVTNVESTLILDEKTTKGSVTANDGPTLAINAHLDDDTFIDVEFNYPAGGGGDKIGGVFNGGLKYELDTGGITIEADTIIPVKVTLEMPSMTLDVDAMGCLAFNGSCEIDGTRTEKTENISDHSTLYTRDEAYASDKTWDNSGSESVQAAFELQDAQAEYIVVDHSSINIDAAYLVDLSGGAQSGLRAMNAVNAAGSAVANGVNVSVAAGGGIQTLSQINTISHSR